MSYKLCEAVTTTFRSLLMDLTRYCTLDGFSNAAAVKTLVKYRTLEIRRACKTDSATTINSQPFELGYKLN